MRFKEALADYLKVKPDAKDAPAKRKLAAQRKRPRRKPWAMALIRDEDDERLARDEHLFEELKVQTDEVARLTKKNLAQSGHAVTQSRKQRAKRKKRQKRR